MTIAEVLLPWAAAKMAIVIKIMTRLLYVDSNAEDMHRHLNTVEKPLNKLGYAKLCPGSKALDALNASLR